MYRFVLNHMMQAEFKFYRWIAGTKSAVAASAICPQAEKRTAFCQNSSSAMGCSAI